MSSIYDKYELVCGLEVHLQLKTDSKAYCADLNEFGASPNSLISPISLGHPGTLPVLNMRSVEYAIRLGIACGCDIARDQRFARKNYFYADLPKGYQITQDKTPICTGGAISMTLKDGTEGKIGLTRIHMEEDAGKSTHDQDPFNSLVDLNRAGVPLLEIVSEPEFRSAEEAYAYLNEVRRLIRYLDICDGNMEEGSMRCDANVSVRLFGAPEFGERTETKNMNSFRNVQRAIEYEFKRQVDAIESGGTIHMETRSYDAVNDRTFVLRSKEEAHDYRYFPEPDIQPLHVSQEEIDKIESELPPLPRELMRKYTQDYGLSAYDAGVLTEEKEVALFFEEVAGLSNKYKAVSNWVTGDIRSWMNKTALGISDFPVSSAKLVELIDLIDEGKVSHTVASQSIFPALIESPDKSPLTIAEELDLIQDSDEGSLKQFVEAALAKYPNKVEAYKAGNKGLIGLFMGEVMKLSERKADPKAASAILKEILDN